MSYLAQVWVVPAVNLDEPLELRSGVSVGSGEVHLIYLFYLFSVAADNQ